jgi:mutator protein MutT
MGHTLRVHVAAGAVVLFENQVLLVRLTKTRGKVGLWGLPGGKVDRGETIEEGMMREVREETGITPDLYAARHLGVIHERPQASCKHVFLINLAKQVTQFTYDTREIMEIRWVPLNVELLKTFNFRTTWILPLLTDIMNDALPVSGLRLYE